MLHLECSPAASCSEVTTIVASKITEFHYYGVYQRHPTSMDLLLAMPSGNQHIFGDICADAMYLFKHVCHRVGILALHEDRLREHLLTMTSWPTDHRAWRRCPLCYEDHNPNEFGHCKQCRAPRVLGLSPAVGFCCDCLETTELSPPLSDALQRDGEEFN